MSVKGAARKALPVDKDERWIDIYRSTIGPLYAYVSRRVGGARGLAEDVVQETYLRGIQRFGPDGAPAQPIAWLKTVARNLVVSHFRRTRPEPIAPTSLDRIFESQDTGTPEEVAALYRGLSRIRRAYARLLESFYFDAKSTRAIAEDLDISERAVQGRLRRARAALRRALSRDGGNSR